MTVSNRPCQTGRVKPAPKRSRARPQALSLLFSLAEIRSKDVYEKNGFRPWLKNLKAHGGKLNMGPVLRFFADVVDGHPSVLLPIDPACTALGATRGTFAPFCDPAQARLTGNMVLLASPTSGVFAAGVVKGPALINDLDRPGFNVFGRGGSRAKDVGAMLLPVQLLEVYEHTGGVVGLSCLPPANDLPVGFSKVDPNVVTNYQILCGLATVTRGRDGKTVPSVILDVAAKKPAAVGAARAGAARPASADAHKKRPKKDYEGPKFTDDILREAFENSIARPDCAWILSHCAAPET